MMHELHGLEVIWGAPDAKLPGEKLQGREPQQGPEILHMLQLPQARQCRMGGWGGRGPWDACAQRCVVGEQCVL